MEKQKMKRRRDDVGASFCSVDRFAVCLLLVQTYRSVVPAVLCVSCRATAVAAPRSLLLCWCGERILFLSCAVRLFSFVFAPRVGVRLSV